MGETLIFDTETDGLLDSLTKLHLIQVGTVGGDDVDLYCADPAFGLPPIVDGLSRLSAADVLIGHNAIKFDFEAIEKLYPGTLRRQQIRDTLVMSRLKHPEERGHSLGAWGTRLGCAKGDFKGPWDVCTPEMVAYARQDIVVGRALYHAVRDVETWGESCILEHDTAWTMAAQERNGFPFDVPAAQKLDTVLRAELDAVAAKLQEAFPPITHTVTWTPKATNKKLGYQKGVPLTKTLVEKFNPASRKQVGKRLVSLGWKPKHFGANGDPTVDEGTLSNLSIPHAKTLTDYFKVLKKLGQLSDGDNAWLKMTTPAGRIHGGVNPNGACTGRMSHFKPNVAQADKDSRMRALWGPRAGWKLVGCDAEGLEARMLGHYLARYDGGAFSDRVVNGVKEERTDVHSANLDALVRGRLLPAAAWSDKAGFKIGRDGAKTILYALMYGAGDAKLGTTLRGIWRDLRAALNQDERRIGGDPKVPPKELGRLVRQALARSMVGLDRLDRAIKERAKKNGYLVGLDGRHLFVRSEHAALNTLLQGGGAIVMKKALQLFTRWTDCVWTSADFGLCANVHDEVQMEVKPDLADEFGRQFADCIRDAGLFLNVRCPLAGAYDVGDNWSQTH